MKQIGPTVIAWSKAKTWPEPLKVGACLSGPDWSASAAIWRNQVRSLPKEIGLLFPRAIGQQFRSPVLRPIVEGLLGVHEQVKQQKGAHHKRVRDEAKADETTRRLMSVPAWAWWRRWRSATPLMTQHGSDRLRRSGHTSP